MAIIDEYKKAVQDVLDGRAPEPPKPSEFPDTDDKLAAQFFAGASCEMAAAHPDGKNILRNAKPIASVLDSGSGWTKAASPAAAVTVTDEPGQYVKAAFSAAGIFQLSKSNYSGGSLRRSAEELRGLIPGASVTVSFDVKSDVAASFVSLLLVKDSQNNYLIRLNPIEVEYVSAVADWTTLSGTFIVPDDFVNVFFGSGMNMSSLIFSVQTQGAGNVWLRNFKLEYGDKATPFTYNDFDVAQVVDSLLIPDDSDAKGTDGENKKSDEPVYDGEVEL